MTPALEQIARDTAAAQNLPVAIVLGMIDREATDDPWAVRFEPAFLKEYVMPQYNAGTIDLTETYCRAISWGVMQVMGQTARELGFTGMYLTELCDPQVGIYWGCRKLAACLKRVGGDLNGALEHYNGGKNPNYGAEVIALASRYTDPPKVQSA